MAEPAGAVIAWGGDVNLGRRQHYRSLSGGSTNLSTVWPLSQADLSIVNLECVVATTGEQGADKGENGPYYYRGRPEMLKVLADVGIDIVATANNHSGDYGSDALIEQAGWLGAVGIGYAGSGRNSAEAWGPVKRRVANINIAFFSIDSTQKHFAASDNRAGTAYIDKFNIDKYKRRLFDMMHNARRHSDVILVGMHWGENFRDRPDHNVRAIGHALIDAGADAVLGAGAHVLQGVEIYNGKPIIYDAGDLLFDAVARRSDDGGVFHLDIAAEGFIRAVRMFPVKVGFGVSQLREGDEARAAIGRFAQQCEELGTVVETNETFANIKLRNEAECRQNFRRRVQKRYNLEFCEHARYLVRPEWVSSQVPDDAHIGPITFGPLRLLGVRINPLRATRRQMLWVESFWCTDKVLDEDIRLDIKAVSTRSSQQKPWGLAMDHDPCDWMMPTSRWVPGVIYRDYFGLRPPDRKDISNGSFELRLGILSRQYGNSSISLSQKKFDVDIPELPDKSASTPFKLSYRSKFPDIVSDCRPGETWTAEQLAAVTGGTWITPPPPGWHIRSVVSIESALRERPEPVLFVCHNYQDRHRHEQYSKPASKSWDIHDRLPHMSEKLAGAIVSRAVKGLPPEFPLLVVDDPIQSIIELGLAARNRFDGPVVAITGTVGKSSTIAMLRHILGDDDTLTTVSNYNSRVGVPTMLASLGQEQTAAILEVAQSALWMSRGPITRLIRPTVAAITEIGLSQTSKVKSIEDVAHWKSRIFEGLSGQRAAVIGDYLECYDQIQEAGAALAANLVVTGHTDKADFKILSVDREREGSKVSIRLPSKETVTYFLPVPGLGMARNSVTALAIAHSIGRNPVRAAEKFYDYSTENACMQRHSLSSKTRRFEVIDDSWNAEYLSMVNALSVIAQEQPRSGGRRIAALGRIVHLGQMSKEIHERLAAPVIDSGVDKIVTHGNEILVLRSQLPIDILGPHFDNAKDMAEYLANSLCEGDVVLMKGSRRDSDFGEIISHLTRRLEQFEF